MDIIEFTKREELGKKARRIKANGFVPCVVYNAKAESFPVSMDLKLAQSILLTATSATIFDATLDGKKMKVVLKEVDRSPLHEEIRHLSFFQIDEEKPMIFTIPFNIIGISPAVKNNLGTLVKALPALEVKCKLADLVASIDIDISTLEHPGQAISVEDITLPSGMTLPNEEQRQRAIVTITQLQKIEEVKPIETDEAAATEGQTTTDAGADTKAEEPAKE